MTPIVLEQCTFMSRQALKLRTLVLHVFSKTGELVSAIGEEHVWKWAANDENLGVIKQNEKALRSRFTPIVKQYLREDPLKLKRLHSAEDLTSELSVFVSMGKEVESCSATLTDIVIRHQAVLLELKKKEKDKNKTKARGKAKSKS
jgi:hypothetical protein